MIAFDATTDIVNAVLDCTYLTQLRTVQCKDQQQNYYQKKTLKQRLFIGTGSQEMSQLEAMLTGQKIGCVFVFDIDKSRPGKSCDQVTQLFIDNFETKFESIANVDEILTQVDIITSVSTSKKATFNDDFIKMGFILLVWRQMHEISESALIKADHIFLNTNCGVLAETEDIFSPLEESVINKSDIDGELGQLINDEKIMMS